MRKIKGLRWYMIALVTLGTVLGYLTRNTVAAAAPTLMEELNISTQQYSYIIAAYSAAYTVMQPVAGYVLDVLGTKIGYAMFAVLWPYSVVQPRWQVAGVAWRLLVVRSVPRKQR